MDGAAVEVIGGCLRTLCNDLPLKIMNRLAGLFQRILIF